MSVTTGVAHTCAARRTGQVVCWGTDDSGRLGIGSPWMSNVPVAVSGLGDLACTRGTECASGFCVDGVCCDSACGGGDLNDCQACSRAAGGTSDGICGPRRAGMICRGIAGVCDVVESCTGTSLACPADGFVPAGTGCGNTAPGMCETAAVCGAAPACPGPAPMANCSAATVAACSASCAPISLRGGIAVEDGLTVEFQGGMTTGEISVRPCDAVSPPPTGYRVVDGVIGKYCWDLEVSDSVSYETPPPIIVCIHYPEAIASSEATFQMVHDDGSGVFAMNTTDRFPDDNTICGFAYSLSPFALVLPADTTPPVFSNVPDPITAFATSTAGARVTYTLPKAVDAIDGTRPVTCSPASGTTFPPGKTTVTCTAADKTGNTAPAAFTVWVQYQAPSDGTFFLAPIRANG
ncbi:MAG TPA: HYR domain-containing protein, partial [Polyangia bacterium]|nr:HYR domain-containing protein [Polyangia bacterium]